MATTETSAAGARRALRTLRVVGVCLFSALGSFLFGLDMGYIGPIVGNSQFKRDVAKLPDWDQKGSEISGATSGFIVSVFSLGCMVSALPLVSSYFLDVLGRKVSIMLGALVFMVGAVIQSAADDVPVMVVGRFISGLSVGILSTVVPLYQSEVAPPRLRGALTSLAQVMVCFGIAVACLCDKVLLPLDAGWRWAVLLPVVPGLALFVGMFFLPRSPRWLVQQGRTDEALRVLRALRSEEDEATAELQEIVADRKAADLTGAPRCADLCAPRVARLLAVGVALQLLQQLTGINAFVSWGPLIFESLGLSGTLFQTLCTSSLFFATLPALYLVDRLGRRSLLLCGAVGMLLANILMALLGTLYTRQEGDQIEVLSQTAGGFIAAAAFLHVTNFAYSWGPTTWVYCAEIFPMKVRGRCVGLTTLSEWAGVFLVNQFTPMLLDSMGFAAFFIFGAFSVAAVALAWWLPETKGVHLEDIDKIFDARFGCAPDKNPDGTAGSGTPVAC